MKTKSSPYIGHDWQADYSTRSATTGRRSGWVVVCDNEIDPEIAIIPDGYIHGREAEIAKLLADAGRMKHTITTIYKALEERRQTGLCSMTEDQIIAMLAKHS